jgi:hypothetical protein
MEDAFVSDPAETQLLQHQQQQEALQPDSPTAPGPTNFLTQQDDIRPDTSDVNVPSTTATGQGSEESDNLASAASASASAAADAAGSTAAPATEVLISCQGLEALLFLDPAFPRGLAKPNWLVRCLCPGCQQQAGPDG